MELSEKQQEERKKISSRIQDKFEEDITKIVTRIALVEALTGKVELLECLGQVRAVALTVVNCLYYEGKIAIKEDGKS